MEELGEGLGEGDGLGVGVGLGAGEGVGLEVGMGDGEGLGVGEGVGLGLGVGLGAGEGVVDDAAEEFPLTLFEDSKPLLQLLKKTMSPVRNTSSYRRTFLSFIPNPMLILLYYRNGMGDRAPAGDLVPKRSLKSKKGRLSQNKTNFLVQ